MTTMQALLLIEAAFAVLSLVILFVAFRAWVRAFRQRRENWRKYTQEGK
jgi:hypothetical protein